MTNAITLAQVQATCTKSHTSMTRGYISRKGGCKIEQYKGRFGEGYKVYTARTDSTQYCNVTYYINKA